MDEYLKPNLGAIAFIATFIGGVIFTLLVLAGVAAYFWPA